MTSTIILSLGITVTILNIPMLYYHWYYPYVSSGILGLAIFGLFLAIGELIIFRRAPSEEDEIKINNTCSVLGVVLGFAFPILLSFLFHKPSAEYSDAVTLASIGILLINLALRDYKRNRTKIQRVIDEEHACLRELLKLSKDRKSRGNNVLHSQEEAKRFSDLLNRFGISNHDNFL